MEEGNCDLPYYWLTHTFWSTGSLEIDPRLVKLRKLDLEPMNAVAQNSVH